MEGARSTRDLSSALFNNDKMVEVVLELNRSSGGPLSGVGSPPTGITTREIARALHVPDDLVKRALARLEAAGLLKQLPRVGGRRGPLPYEVLEGRVWRALVELAAALAAT